MAADFARFLGIPLTHRMTQAQIMTSVCDTSTRAGVRLVMIDEIHRLNPLTTTGAEATDLLKDLTERIAATFVYVGIDVTATPLFTGTRGAQLAGRATLIDCGTSPPAGEPASPSATWSPPSRPASISTDTGLAPCPASPSTSMPASAVSPVSYARPPSPQSSTTPNASPKPAWEASPSTTSPKTATALDTRSAPPVGAVADTATAHRAE
ncbi:hypothetical protein ACIPJK_39235 [Streptomyces roseus]|uniref:hypothetical protein n=1 Tax=Streptomyces roseus TaxID=66430 RepID=UPI00381D9860